MKIYKMTATFGKLEHETLELQPGLNIITAPNEWGKSTWCAFLAAMLYGLDTRAKSTKTALADKTRYAPWSGSPMAGRIDLNWNGRDITIERRTKGRIPLGEFQAYETASGLPVAELTAANCGEMLLGVEQSVFRRAGFVRLTDLPVTQDEALRRRLNDLVTTGDESGAGDRLEKDLRDLKNRCRYNRSGLLPQAEAQRDALEEKLSELENLDAQSKKLKMRIDEVKTWLQQLRNHQDALAYAEAEADAARVAQARDAKDQAERQLTTLEAACAKLPSQEEAEEKARRLRAFREQWNAIQMEAEMLPAEPQDPEPGGPFAGMPGEAAVEMAKKDAQTYADVSSKGMSVLLIVIGIFGLAASALLVYLMAYVFAAVAGALSVFSLIWGIVERISMGKKAKALKRKYGNSAPKQWLDAARRYEKEQRAYSAAMAEYTQTRADVETRLAVLRRERDSLCGAQEPEKALEFWQQVSAQWEAYHNARREAQRAQNHFETLSAMAKTGKKPAMEDHLTFSGAETARLVSDCTTEQQRLQNRLGQYQGRMETLGDKAALEKDLAQVNDRIAKLEDTYAALTIAQDTLAQARAELQRRFAPRITKRAQELLAAMTDGRYSSVTMSEDFSLQTGAGEEDTLREALWRSDGTIDQLYLALRLAVAEELTPEAPLILDDALVRFDDTRLKAVLEILRQEAETKQVIVFSCQDRENKASR